MAIELILEGQMEKESDKDTFVEFIKSICEEYKIKVDDFGDSLLMDICPEGYIQCGFEGTFISIDAQTNIAGPGFHAYVASVYDEILSKSGITFDVNDSTGYYENRDFEELKYKYFYPWLEKLAEYVEEHYETNHNMRLCWSMKGYYPLERAGFVATPMGDIAVDEFIAADIEELAEKFFIWNDVKKNAKYYLNCAYSLLWKECYFQYTLMNEYTIKITNTILDYLEAAYDEDNLQALPYDIYEELCTYSHREMTIHGKSEKAGFKVGYRKQTVHFTFGNWLIPCSGFVQQNYDSIAQTLNFMAPYHDDNAPWKWLMSASVTKVPEEEIMSHANAFSFEEKKKKGFGFIEKTTEYLRMVMQIKVEDECLLLESFIKEEQDLEILKQWCMNVDYLSQDFNEIMH